jgi:hypothetical protein
MSTDLTADSSNGSLKNLEFKVLIQVDCDHDQVPVYIAQCLNFDLVAQGETVSDVLDSLKRVIKTQITVDLNNGIAPFSDFEVAPWEFQATYDKIQDKEAKAFSFEFDTNVRPGDLDAEIRSVSGVALMKLPV